MSPLFSQQAPQGVARRGLRRFFSFIVPGSAFCFVTFTAQLGFAKPLSAEERALYEQATQSLKKGAPTEAIQQFELLADRGIYHPDVSYDRAIAYLERARSPKAKPGDRGRAACALSESLVLRPEDEAAEALLAQVDRELSRERSRRGTPSLLARDRISRALVGLLSENTWAVTSLFFSALTTVGLWLRITAKAHRSKLTGSIAIALGTLLGVLALTGLLFAVDERRHTQRGVVVAQDAQLLDITGAPLSRKQLSAQDRIIPEGARVLVKGRTERLLFVEWGNTDAYVSPTDVQLLPKRE
jgi:hypothetical protein